MTTAYIAKFSDGQLRLYASRKAALAHERRIKGVGIVDGAEVAKERHYRGQIPPKGIAFTAEDQSTAELEAAMQHN